MITTDRLTMRRARPGDLDGLHRVFRDPRAMRYWDTLPHTETSQTQAFLDAMIAAPPACSDDFVVELDGHVIGKAGCWRSPDVGIMLHPDHWGKGLAFEALTAVIPHIFDTLDVDHLIADVDPRNAASLALMKRLGFVKTGYEKNTVKLGEEWCDSVYLRLNRPT